MTSSLTPFKIISLLSKENERSRVLNCIHFLELLKVNQFDILHTVMSVHSAIPSFLCSLKCYLISLLVYLQWGREKEHTHIYVVCVWGGEGGGVRPAEYRLYEN